MVEIDEHEQIVRIVWRHWFVLLGRILALVFAVFVPVICLFAFNLIPVDDLVTLEGSKSAAAGFFLTAWFIVIWILGWNIWTNYFLNVLLITDIRIFDIEQKGFFRRKSSSFRIDHIQNVSVTQSACTSRRSAACRSSTAPKKSTLPSATSLVKPLPSSSSLTPTCV
jgi:hypothetical protein